MRPCRPCRSGRAQRPRSVNSARASSRDACSVAPSYGVRRRLEVEQPVRARLLLVRHADAARVDDAHARDDAVELHVRVADDDDVGVDVRRTERRCAPRACSSVKMSRSLRGDACTYERRRSICARRRQAVQELDLLVASAAHARCRGNPPARDRLHPGGARGRRCRGSRRRGRRARAAARASPSAARRRRRCRRRPRSSRRPESLRAPPRAPEVPVHVVERRDRAL